MCNAEYKAYADAFSAGRSFEQALIDAKEAVKNVVKNKMILFESAGKA
jgi:hypothetical protein